MNSIYKGMKKDMSVNIDELRDSGLEHDALQDALDNAKILKNIYKETKPEN